MRLSDEFKVAVKTLLPSLPTVFAMVVSARSQAELTSLVGVFALCSILEKYVLSGLPAGGYKEVDQNTLFSRQVNEIAKKSGLSKSPKIYELEDETSLETASFFGAGIRSVIAFNRKACTADEESFALAHEMAHIKRNDVLLGAVGMGAFTYSLLFSLVSGSMAAYSLRPDEFTDSIPYIQNTFLHLTACFIQGASRKSRNHTMEFDCDKRAAIALGTIRGGVSFHSKSNYKSSFSHPSCLKRVEALKKLDL